MSSTGPSTFTCAFCQYEKRSLRVRVANDTLCMDCYNTEIVPKFHAAVDNEAQYPVRWGSTMLEPRLFPASFQTTWRHKCKEYQTPFPERVYCKHNNCMHYVGNRTELRGTEVMCMKCYKGTCGDCGGSVGTTENVHRCIPEEPADEPDAFAGLVLGKDYQICPGATCGIKVNLRDGCNAMICERCTTHFCYLCGVAARHNSNHWTTGSACSRWNHPDGGNAIHDEDGDYAEDDEDAEEDEPDVEEAQRLEDLAMQHREAEAEARRRQQRFLRELPPVMLPEESPEMIQFLSQRGDIQGIIREIYRVRAGFANGQAPEWTGWFINFAGLLRRNLQWFAMDRAAMHYETRRHQDDTYDDRHRTLMTFIPRVGAGLDQYPRMRALFNEYMLMRH